MHMVQRNDITTRILSSTAYTTGYEHQVQHNDITTRIITSSVYTRVVINFIFRLIGKKKY